MMANIVKIEEAAMSARKPKRDTVKFKEDFQMKMARKLADYLGEVTGYETFDTADLPSFFQALLRGPTEVPFVAAEDLRSSDVDHNMKEVFEGGDVLNWWSSELQLLLPVCDGDEDRSTSVLNKSQLNESLQYLRTHINIIFEGKYFMKVHHKVQHLRHQSDKDDDDYDDEASKSYHQERLTSQEMSIFTLSNLLRQPIIVLSKVRTRDSVTGIYLPLRVAPSDCKKWPVVIGYHLGTYYPLIAVKEEHHFDAKFLLPLVHSDLRPFVVKCKSFANASNCKDLRDCYLNTVTYQNDQLAQICAAQLQCPAVKRTTASYECRTRVQKENSRTVLSKQIESKLWTPHKNVLWNNTINQTKDCEKDTRDFTVTRCLAEGCDHAASLVSKHPLCASCEALMKRRGVIRIGLMSTAVRPMSRTRTSSQHSYCRCPCGKNGGSVSSSDEEYSESDDNPNDESLNDLNVLNDEFRNLDTCYMNLPIDCSLRI